MKLEFLLTTTKWTQQTNYTINTNKYTSAHAVEIAELKQKKNLTHTSLLAAERGRWEMSESGWVREFARSLARSL
jgi:hypothetical protein